MSASLGKIHYWLFNKIQLHEKLIDTIAESAMVPGSNTNENMNSNVKEAGVSQILEQSYKKYGSPVKGSLENEIENSNIHGWLQERIISVESRLAYVITELLKIKAISVAQISELFTQNGEQISKEKGTFNGNLQDCFDMIFDYMLEGMPCDRVTETIESTESTIKWKTTKCLHKSYWDEVGGNIENFYLFRDSWINGFLSASNAGLIYNRTNEAIRTIRRV